MGRTISTRTPGKPYDDGIYQADTRYTPQAPDINTIPLMCGQSAPSGRTTHCLRLIRTQSLHRDLADIVREIATLSRMRNDWKARNLIGWVEFSIRRFTYQLATWELPECTCAADGLALTELTHDLELTYPPCTC
jgi:hypothetical protein